MWKKLLCFFKHDWFINWNEKSYGWFTCTAYDGRKECRRCGKANHFDMSHHYFKTENLGTNQTQSDS